MRRCLLISSELEVLTGKLIRGDITPLVYELIKDSAFIDDIFEISTVEKEVGEDVSEGKIPGYADNISNVGFDFKNWLTNEVQSISTHGTGRKAKRHRESGADVEPW